MSIESKFELKCDANGCSSCYKSAVSIAIALPSGWTEKEGKHYCKTHSPKKELSKKTKKAITEKLKTFTLEFSTLDNKRNSLLDEVEKVENRMVDLSEKTGIPFEISSIHATSKYTPKSFSEFAKLWKELEEAEDDLELNTNTDLTLIDNVYYYWSRNINLPIGCWSSSSC